MIFYLDTNTCIYFLNGRYESVKDKILATSPAKIAIPAIVKAELLLGAYKSSRSAENTQKVEKFLQPFAIVPFSDAATYKYAEIRSQTEKSGQCVGPNDLVIAAIVMADNATLITNNVSEFQRIKKLKLENWCA